MLIVVDKFCQMPVDGHNDEVSNDYGIEQSYYSALKVYKMLGQPDRLGLLRVPGFHGANDQEACLDWLDIQFGRSARTWSNTFLFPWDWEQWKTRSKETVDLARYPKHSGNNILQGAAGAAINSREDWEKKAATIRQTMSRSVMTPMRWLDMSTIGISPQLFCTIIFAI